MRYLSVILWILLGILYWWIWDTNHHTCCGDGVSGTTNEQSAIASSDDDTKNMDEAESEALAAAAKARQDSIAAEEAKKAIASAADNNEVTAVSSTTASGSRKLVFYFPYNSQNAQYSASTQNDLNDLIAYAKSSGKTIKITGHTDSMGNSADNMTLGLLRANKIRDRIVAGGIPTAKVTARSEGQNSPVASNDTSSGRQQNRRVELIIE